MPALILIASGDDPNMRYATGLPLHDPFIWVKLWEGKRGKEYVIVSGLEHARVTALARPNTKVVLLDTVDLSLISKPVRRKRNLADIAAAFLASFACTEAIVPENAWTSHVETLREHGIRAQHRAPFFPSRICKRDHEVAAIKETGLVAKKALRRALQIIEDSTIDWNNALIWRGKRLTSEQIRYEIHTIFLQHGCESAETIVSCGEASARPHDVGSGNLLAGEPIIIDLFPRDTRSGYFFDMTRTVVKGTPRRELVRLYDAVRRAHLAAIAAVRPGVKARDVHLAAQRVLDDAGFKTTGTEGFIHSVGHGLGLAIHEPPGLGPKSDELLRRGMVVAIEPGLYYPDLGGVRIEDTVLVTGDGCANLTNVPKRLTIK